MKKLVFLLLLCVSTIFNPVFAKINQSICFYYNEVDAVRELINYQRVVLDPNQVTNKQIAQLHSAGVKVYSYISVGEFDGDLPDLLKPIKKSDNDEWESNIMDIASPIWHGYLLDTAKDLKKRGFDGLFLDTLDSFNDYASPDDNKAEFTKAVNGETALVDALHTVFKDLIFNRGFEIYNSLSFKPTAVAAESVFKSYNASDESYGDVSKDDRQWLCSKLDAIKDSGVEAIAIDYLPDSSLQARIDLAKNIASLGYTPYVSDGMLYGFGVSFVYSVPKRVLGLYDGRYANQPTSAFHNRLTTPIEYLGYAVDTVDINKINLNLLDKTRYAAIICYPESAGAYAANPEFENWLVEHVGYIKTLFLTSLPSTQEFLDAYGIKGNDFLTPPLKLTKRPESAKGLLTPMFSNREQYTAFHVDENKGFSVYARLEDSFKKTSDFMFSGSWGGAALDPYPVDTLNNNSDVWLVDPFSLIEKTLSLPQIPAADVTTESGNRILTSHVDGDGFPSKSWFKGTPLVSEVLYDEVFSKIEVPHTLSVIEGEVAPDGMYPKDAPMLEELARKIFALENVEVASHTYSHPFDWDLPPNHTKLLYGEHLPIPGYKAIDYDKEMEGSINYINQKLCPKGKKVKVFLWSGNANPTAEQIEKIDNFGILNVNGGNTNIVKGRESLTNVSPTVCSYKNGVQVYAPNLNENVYTNEWTEHFDGFSRAKESFEITGSPRRLKSIGIYYHMYSGTYKASLDALKSLYSYALSQEITPLYLSDYATRARTLYETGLAKDLNGQWQITSTGIRSIRVPKSFGYPSSASIVGFNDCEDGNYLILNKNRNQVSFVSKMPNRIMLKSANGIVEKWDEHGNRVDFQIKSYVPLKFKVWTQNQCQLVSSEEFKHGNVGQVHSYETDKKGVFTGTLICNK